MSIYIKFGNKYIFVIGLGFIYLLLVIVKNERNVF